MNIIYTPSGRAGEYANKGYAANLFTGCPHGCKYCYRAANRFVDREKFHSIVEPRKNVLKLLEKDLQKLGKIDEPIFLCFTCDPFPFLYGHDVTWRAIQLIHASGNHVRILTKYPHAAAFGLLIPGDEVWATLTFDNITDSNIWEPGTTDPAQRMETMEWLHTYRCYVKTGISFEPVINPEQTLRMARRMAKSCDTIKFGKLNHANLIPDSHKHLLKDIDWKQFALDVVALMADIGYTNYVLKDDLKAYLPEVPK